MKNYYVVQVSKCPSCGGKGVHFDPQWQRYWDEYQRRFSATPDWRDADAFWDEFWGNNEPPPEEYTCIQCNGSGAIEDRIPLEKALLELGILKGEGA